MLTRLAKMCPWNGIAMPTTVTQVSECICVLYCKLPENVFILLLLFVCDLIARELQSGGFEFGHV